MVNLVIINSKNTTASDEKKIKDALERVFRYTDEVNAHVFVDFKSPVDTLGVYNYLFFLEIPYRQGNYFRTQSKVYLNNIVFAIRKITDTSIIDVKNGIAYTASGELDYKAQIYEECLALKQYVRNNFSLQYFDFSLFYSIEAPNCPIQGYWGNLMCNVPTNLYKIVSKTIDDLKGEKNGTYSVIPKQGETLSNFIASFISNTDARTNHGILTKKKIDAISTKEIGKQMQLLYDSAGQKMEIVTGKAGTGKSLALLRFMYNNVQNHHCRLLTFNNLLVMDTKMALRNIGDFTPTNASITTLHKFFYDMYVGTPVCKMHMDENQVERLFSTCHRRVSTLVVLIEKYAEEQGFTRDIAVVFDYYKGKGVIMPADEKEMKYFISFMSKQEDWTLSNLHELATTYEQEKRERFIQLYGQTAFLSGYRIIMEQLFLLFHNSDEFLETFGRDLLSHPMTIRETDEFKAKYAKLYDAFIQKCKSQFSEEHGIPNDLFSQYLVDEQNLINQLRDGRDIAESTEEQREKANDIVKSIKRKVSWSKYVLIDEAQDCANYEKELLLELFGSSNIIIASGGKDQLIRTPIETQWEVSFGNRIDCEKVNLTHVSHRQKGNVIEFINAFSKDYGLDTELSVLDSIKDTGRVIIDMRNGVSANSIPEDIVKNLRLSGSDYGCSDYESMMLLLPNEGFTSSHSEGSVVTIDKDNTIAFDGEDKSRSLAITLSDDLNLLDCTITGKSQLLKEVGHDKTRCLLYESCRGLEAWSVLCLGLDTFFDEKQISSASSDYADEALGLFKDDESQRKAQREKYAALWLLMAFTRAMDTLYISFSSVDSAFAKRIEKIGATLPFVQIIK